jgi:hypothetical protein
MLKISRRDLISGTLSISAAGWLRSSVVSNKTTKPVKLADVGWSWEGQGIVGGVGYGGAGLSIFGVGEGAEYFGLRKVFCMYQSANDTVLEKLKHFEEVVCEISPDRHRRCGNDDCVQLHYDPKPMRFLEEARNVGEMSLRYLNIKGGYIDDTLGEMQGDKGDPLLQELTGTLVTEVDKVSFVLEKDGSSWDVMNPETVKGNEGHYVKLRAYVYADKKAVRVSTVKQGTGAITSELYSSIYSTLKKHNPELKLWALVFIEQLYNQGWADFKPCMDVVNLGMWDHAKEVPDIDKHLDKCREVFPDRPIMLGCILWEFPLVKPVPMGLLKQLWEHLLKYVQNGKIDGYTILGSHLIDAAPQQARWIRDFIAAN